MRTTGWVTLWLAMAGVLVGCASTGEGTTARRDYNVITAEEKAETGSQVRNLYELVDRLRPRWLEARSTRSMGGFTEIVVFQDETMLGTAEDLRRYGVEYGSWLEYLDASQANARFGGLSNRNIGGAIVIHMRPPR